MERPFGFGRSVQPSGAGYGFLRTAVAYGVAA